LLTRGDRAALELLSRQAWVTVYRIVEGVRPFACAGLAEAGMALTPSASARRENAAETVAGGDHRRLTNR
jgi:hypothetical protein